MKLSAHKEDGDYHDIQHYVQDVLLDGRPIKNVIRFNTWCRTITAYMTKPDGDLQLTPDGQHIMTQDLTGTVTITWKNFPVWLWQDWLNKMEADTEQPQKSHFPPKNGTDEPLASTP